MNSAKIISYLHLVIIIFVVSILIVSSAELSFAKKDSKDNDINGLNKGISNSLVAKDKENLNVKSKQQPNIQNDIINSQYPEQFFVCGYPQQIITDYNSFEKINCN